MKPIRVLGYFGIVMLMVALVIATVRATARNRGSSVPSADPPSTALIVIDVLGGASMVACWVGSIYVWARPRRSGLIHALVLPFLLLFGLLVGPFYIVLSKRGQNGEASAGAVR